MGHASAFFEERQLRQLRSALLTVCGLISCAPVTGVNDDHQIPVVNAVLVSGQSTQSLTVRWAGTPGDPNPGTGPAAGDVNLWISSSAGDSAPVVTAGTLGRYTIALTAQAGVTYRLRGTILGVPVMGTTTVPALAVITPSAGDTLSASQLDAHNFGRVSFTLMLAASGAAGYNVTGADFVESTQGRLLSGLDDSLTLFYHRQGPLPVHATITAFDSNAAEFYGVIQVDIPGAPVNDGFIQTTLTGTLGLFGSSTSAAIDVVVVP